MLRSQETCVSLHISRVNISLSIADGVKCSEGLCWRVGSLILKRSKSKSIAQSTLICKPPLYIDHALLTQHHLHSTPPTCTSIYHPNRLRIIYFYCGALQVASARLPICAHTNKNPCRKIKMVICNHQSNCTSLCF